MSGYIYRLQPLKLDNESLLNNETIFHNANGYIGVRGCFEEGLPKGIDTIRGTYINGFYNFCPMNQAEKLFGLCERKQTILNVADTQGIKLVLDGEEFSMFDMEVLDSSRVLYMDKGYSAREVLVKLKSGKKVKITFNRMTSFERKNLFLQEVIVESVNFNGEIEFISTHIGDVTNYCNPDDPRVAAESFDHLSPVSAKEENKISILTTKTTLSDLTVSSFVTEKVDKKATYEGTLKGHQSTHRFALSLTSKETVKFTKYSVFTDSVRYEDTESEGLKIIKELIKMPVEDLYKEQAAYMAEFFEKTSLSIEGDDDLSIAITYNMYALLESVSKDRYGNIAAKGLSGEGYEGHYFWDTEMYMQPFFTLTNPKLSKNLISYRFKTLDKARENAKILGHKKGALYPWRTIMGEECSGYFPSGTAQYHIDGDIAYSVIAYYIATNDFDFIAKEGAEIVFETARLFLDTGFFDGDRFVINCVTGPDEYTCVVNNNYFTNASAQYNFHWAVKFYKMLVEANNLEIINRIKLTKDEIVMFERAEKLMYLPYDETLGINPQDDSFLHKEVWDFKNTPKENYPLLLHYHPLHIYRYQVCKQADTVLAHFIYEDAQSLETIKKSFEYYEKITTHDSSLSTCIYSIVASKLRQVDKAYKYFGDSAKLDLFNLHHNTKDGIHTANMGGNYMAVVYGFGGLRLKETGLYLSPIIPKEWKAYKFNVCYQNSLLNICVDKENVTVKLLSGEAVEIRLYDKKLELSDEIKVKVEG